MESFLWTYCLNEEQFNKLYRIIRKVPGLEYYLKNNNDRDLARLIVFFNTLYVSEKSSTPGIRVNLELLKNRFIMFKKEYEEKNRIENCSSDDFNLFHVLTWNPRPKWSKKMSVEEIDYLDHLIPNVVGLPEYLHKNINKENLYDLIVAFQLQLNATGSNDANINFQLEVIKERFYRIMDDHKDAIHYVNHSQEINDHRLLDQFTTEAAISFYPLYAQDEKCIDFANKYASNFHPYIASEIFQKFLRANKIDEALHFAHQVFDYLFASPNIYWHNKEAIFGYSNIMRYILNALGHKGVNILHNKEPKFQNVFLETLYLILSRMIYWTDKETNKDDRYDDTLRPINIQHKLSAYRLRAFLIESYGEELADIINEADISKMCYADFCSAHNMAFEYNIVGQNSIYKRDANRLFHLNRIFDSCTPEQAAEEGFNLNDELAMAIHKKYKEGEYCLTKEEVTEFISILRMYFKNEQIIALKNNEPISYLQKDNFSPSYKTDKEEIRRYLQENGIKCLYHFTEKNRIESIKKYGGLLSLKRCLDEGVAMPVREDMASTRDIDAQKNLEDYVRTSFCSKLPKIKERQEEGAELVLLKIDPEVALFEDTIYTDIEATQSNMQYGKEMDDLLKVNFQATKKEYSRPEDNDYWQRQAEVLVKGFIPLKYILNISSPEILS